MVDFYYISDGAYEHLISYAINAGYIKKDKQRPRGLSEFLIDLVHQTTLVDTRPEHIREKNKQEILFLRAPSWSNAPYRVKRLLTLDEDTKLRYYQVAIDVGIILASRPWVIGGPPRSSLTAITAAVLEAIGLGWITPVKLPMRKRLEMTKRGA